MIDNQKDTDFLAYLISGATLFYGLNLIYSDNYLIERFSLWALSPMVEDLIGLAFIIIAGIEIIGLKSVNKHMKRIGIISMIILWALIVGLYIFEAFDFQFLGLILTVPILVICLRIARRGDYIE